MRIWLWQFAVVFVFALLIGLPIVAPIGASGADTVNPVGIGVNQWTDWDTSKPLVDVMKLARGWERPSGAKARTDANGWPLEDAVTIMWTGLAAMNGTYKLSFTGKANVAITWGKGRIENQSYSSATDTTTADLIVDTADKNDMQLSFTRHQAV